MPAALEAERVDRGVALLVGLSRVQASRLVDEGRVRISGVVVRAGSRRLRGGERLEVDLAGHSPLEPPGSVASTPSLGSPPLEAEVVFADKDLVVVDKPAGLVVHPGAGNPRGTLVQQLVALFPDISAAGPEDERPGIVQRLDKGTSGLMVVARTPAAREGLVAQLAARSVERAYLAVVHGELEADEGTVDAPLGRSQSHRVKMAVVQGGRHAAHSLPRRKSFLFAGPGHPGVLPARDRPHPPGAGALRRHWPPGALRRPLLQAQPVGRRPDRSAGAPPPLVARRTAWFRTPSHRRTHAIFLRAASGSSPPP